MALYAISRQLLPGIGEQVRHGELKKSVEGVSRSTTRASLSYDRLLQAKAEANFHSDANRNVNAAATRTARVARVETRAACFQTSLCFHLGDPPSGLANTSQHPALFG